MAGHSPEPWVAAGFETTCLYEGVKDIDRRQLFIAKRENVRRIIACVNFCAGYDTGMLENNSLKAVLEAAREKK